MFVTNLLNFIPGEFYGAVKKLTFLKKLFYLANSITLMVDGPF